MRLFLTSTLASILLLLIEFNKAKKIHRKESYPADPLIVREDYCWINEHNHKVFHKKFLFTDKMSDQGTDIPIFI